MMIGWDRERERGGGWNDVDGFGGLVVAFFFFFFFGIPKYAVAFALSKRIISGIRVLP